MSISEMLLDIHTKVQKKIKINNLNEIDRAIFVAETTTRWVSKYFPQSKQINHFIKLHTN